jgi:hypothetical protein
MADLPRDYQTAETTLHNPKLNIRVWPTVTIPRLNPAKSSFKTPKLVNS